MFRSFKDEFHESASGFGIENVHDHDLPKPKEDVDFLVDDVERKQTERVVLLNFPGRPKLVERALKS